MRLRPDPLEVNGQVDPSAPITNPFRSVAPALRTIRDNRLAMLGLSAMVISQAAMVAVMTMTPPHMRDHDHADLSALVIALHIGGMYGFAPLVGRLVERIGQVKAIMVGAVVLGSGTIVSVVAGYAAWLIFVGLFFLGLGWNIGLIGGSSLLVQSTPIDRRVEVQGTADLTMSFCGGLSAFGSGFVKQAWGFHILADAATIVAGVLLVSAYVVNLQPRRVAAA
jgi:MFS family permease